MINPQTMADHFALSLHTIHMQTGGLTHAETLLQLPFRGPCMNWTLGHILLSREEVLDLLDVPRLFSDDAFQRYVEDSPAITQDEPGVIFSEELLEMLDEHSLRFSEALLNTSEARYAGDVQVGSHKRSLARRVLFAFFHEATHVGELGLLRELAGRDGPEI